MAMTPHIIRRRTPTSTATRRPDTAPRRAVRVAAALLMAGGGSLALFALGPAASADGARIAVTTTPLPSVEGCQPAALAVSPSTFSDSSIFRLRLTVSAPLCEPVNATAVIYAMPTDGSAWPQTLAEKATVTLARPAVVDITFTRNCTPSQYDVVTGATPDHISFPGPMHGPLLVPDDRTAQQDPGIVCAPATTTTAPTTTTSIPSNGSSSTTTPQGVLGATTTTPATTTSAAVAVLAESTPRSGSSGSSGSGTSGTDGSSGVGSQLAVTGVPSQRLALTGMLMVATGIAMMLGTRRRNVPSMQMITSHSSVEPSSPFSTS